MPQQSNSGPVIAVDSAGRRASWCDGVFNGDEAVTQDAQVAIETRAEVSVLGRIFEASDLNLEGVVAALFASNPGRTVLVEAPEELLAEMFDSDGADDPTK